MFFISQRTKDLRTRQRWVSVSAHILLDHPYDSRERAEQAHRSDPRNSHRAKKLGALGQMPRGRLRSRQKRVDVCMLDQLAQSIMLCNRLDPSVSLAIEQIETREWNGRLAITLTDIENPLLSSLDKPRKLIAFPTERGSRV